MLQTKFQKNSGKIYQVLDSQYRTKKISKTLFFKQIRLSEISGEQRFFALISEINKKNFDF